MKYNIGDSVVFETFRAVKGTEQQVAIGKVIERVARETARGVFVWYKIITDDFWLYRKAERFVLGTEAEYLQKIKASQAEIK